MRQLLIGLLIMMSSTINWWCLADDNHEANLSKLEKRVLGIEYPKESSAKRLARLENKVFGQISNSSISGRIQKLNQALHIANKPIPQAFSQTKTAQQTQPEPSKITKVQIQKNQQEVADTMLKVINQERSFRSLGALTNTELADQVALEHASYLVQTKQFSHYGVAGTNPDQRYTKAGGTGRIEEIVDGFFAQVNQKGEIIPIKIDEKTADHLMDAILKVPDKMDILFNQDANAIGISFVLSPDRKQLAVVIEIVVDYLSLADLPNKTEPAAVQVNGSIESSYYKFAWIGIAKKDEEEIGERVEVEPSPYFPPIDKVIYADRSTDRAKSIAKTSGLILAMVAAPFTYGASILVADILMQSLSQAYQAQDVEVREGIKASNSSFDGLVNIGEWGSGIYYVSIWAFPKGSKKPVVISRQTIKVV